MEKNLRMVRGDTLSFAVEIEFDDDPQNLETAYFTCKQNYDDSEPLFQVSLGEGIEKVKEEGNSVFYRVRVAPQNTSELDLGIYYYDLEIGLNDDIFTVLRGALKLDGDVTR